MSIGMLIAIILGLLLVWFVGIPIIKNILAGSQSAYVCDGNCASNCAPDEYHDWHGDLYCKESFDMPRCCVGSTQSGGQVVRQGDIRLYYNNDQERQLRNGASVTLQANIDNKDNSIATGAFQLSFGGTANEKRCYWQVGLDDEEPYDITLSGALEKTLFKTLFETYEKRVKDHKNPDLPTVTSLAFCKDFTSKSALEIPYLPYMGKRFKINLVVIDPELCTTDEVYSCKSYTHTVYASVPDRQPAIALKVERETVSPKTVTRLPVDETINFDLGIKDPYQVCSVDYAVHPALEEQGVGHINFPLDFSGIDQDETSDGHILNDKECFADSYRKKFDLNLPKTIARGIPFTLTVNTSMTVDGEERLETQTYQFQIAPEERLIVNGPTPGLSREKYVDLTCPQGGCNGRFFIKYLENPFDCNPGELSGFTEVQAPAYGSSADKDPRWRLTIKGEENNTEFLCVKAETSNEPYVALGMHNGIPSVKMIDNTSPKLEVKFNSFDSVLTFNCHDQGEYQSGCKERPISYAFITNPLMFVTNIVTGGLLDSSFSGCPNPETGYWIQYNSLSNEMFYNARDVRVICVKAEDAAGNYAVENKLLFSSQQALALLLKEAAN